MASTLAHLIELSCDAALSRQRDWSDFVAEVARIFDTTQAVLVMNAPDRGFGRAEGTIYLDARYRCDDYAVEEDVLMQQVWSAPRGTLSLAQCVDQNPAIADTNFYASFLARHGLRHFIHTLIPQPNRRTAFFCVTRNADQQPFSPAEIETMEALVGCLKPLFRHALHRDAQTDTMFELSTFGLVLLDGNARVVAANPAANRMNLSDWNPQIQPISGLDRNRLADVISGDAFTPIAFQINRDAAPPLSCLLRPVPEEWRSMNGGEAAALIVLSDPLCVRCPEPDILISQYKMTLREAQLTQLLVKMQELKSVAALLGIAHETARRHLSSIFEKTQTHSQSALIYLMTGHPSVLSKNS